MHIVTGAAGLIGSALVWALNERGIDDIIVVDHLGMSDKWKNLRALKYSDYFEKDAFLELLLAGKFDASKINSVFHMGACSATTERDASYLANNNYTYTKELALFCLANNIRFVYASSSATYGDGSQGFDDDENKLDALRPMNMYGYSKHMFDLMAKKSGYLCKIVGLKFTNVFGPNEHHKGDMRSVVHRAFEQVRDTGRIELFKSYKQEYADGEQMRDFLYVKDAVDMVLSFMDSSVAGIYNIGSGRAETWNSLAEAIFDAMGVEKKIKYIEMPEHLKDRYQYYTKAEMGKLAKTGYAGKARPLKDSVKDYIQNYLIPGKYLGD